MPNDSSSGGYVAGTGMLADAALDAVLQAMVVGITGLLGNMVRPRWQVTPPKQPDAATDWCAIGVQSLEGTDYPIETHDPTGNGNDVQTDWDELSVLASFYGPNAQGNAKALRRGLYVDQNREAIKAQGIDLVDAETITAAPALVNEQWIKRYDLPIKLRRGSASTYPILNLLSAPTSITRN